MRPPILLLIAAGLAIPGCGKGRETLVSDSPLASELKLLERQVASLKTAVADARKGELFPPNSLAVGASEEVVQGALAQALPIEKPVGKDFVARIDRALVSFRSMQGSVKLQGRVWARSDPLTFADLVLLGGIQDVEIDKATGVLKAEIVLDGWDVQRASASGMEFEWTKSLVRLLGDRGLNALRDLVPPVRIPVGIEQGIDLPGTAGNPVSIPSGRLPLTARVSRVLPLSGRLWAMIEITTSGWEQAAASPTTRPAASPRASEGR